MRSAGAIGIGRGLSGAPEDFVAHGREDVRVGGDAADLLLIDHQFLIGQGAQREQQREGYLRHAVQSTAEVQ
jgi:hypothetical protein